MKQKLQLLVLLLFGLQGILFSQDKILGLEQTLDIIRKYHPVAKQANLAVNMVERHCNHPAALLILLLSEYRQKNFQWTGLLFSFQSRTQNTYVVWH